MAENIMRERERAIAPPQNCMNTNIGSTKIGFRLLLLDLWFENRIPSEIHCFAFLSVIVWNHKPIRSHDLPLSEHSKARDLPSAPGA